MTLIKSTLLGSAAGILAVAGAQAADLPTHKAAPVVEYVRICNVGGIVGWTLPGSDTCLKISGYITAQVHGGNLNTQYNWASVNGLADAIALTNPALSAKLAAFGAGANLTTQRVLFAASDTQHNTTFQRNEVGWTTRANLAMDMASNTPYGPLLGHFDFNFDIGTGFENLSPTNEGYINTAYLTWAGLTAGKAQSFFSFTGGGLYWPNFFSPDRKGFNEPILMAYTASFGGGFTATIAAQSSSCNGGTYNSLTGSCGAPSGSGGGTDVTQGTLHYGGTKWPDFVGALHVKQGWGEAQVSGVIHDVNVFDPAYNVAPFNNVTGSGGCGT